MSRGEGGENGGRERRGGGGREGKRSKGKEGKGESERGGAEVLSQIPKGSFNFQPFRAFWKNLQIPKGIFLFFFSINFGVFKFCHLFFSFFQQNYDLFWFFRFFLGLQWISMEFALVQKFPWIRLWKIKVAIKDVWNLFEFTKLFDS